MTSYAPNFTGRLRVKYRAGRGTHTQTWRFPAYGVLGAGMIAARDAVEAIWGHLTPVAWSDTTCLGVTYAQENSDIFLPTDPIDISGAVDVVAFVPANKADNISLVGRTALGQPAKMFFYGITIQLEETAPNTDFRVQPTESTEIDGAIAEANGFIAGLILCGSDAEAVTWYNYANYKPNDYWVKRIRQGS